MRWLEPVTPTVRPDRFGWCFSQGRQECTGICLSLFPASLNAGLADQWHAQIALPALSLFPVERCGGKRRSGGQAVSGLMQCLARGPQVGGEGRKPACLQLG